MSTALGAETEIRNPTDNLLHCVNDASLPLPGWSRFFLSVGRAAISVPPPDQRLVVAAVVPTREFAAAFVALGAVEQRSKAGPPASGPDHYQQLSDLAKGDKVTVLQAGKKYVATFEGVGQAQGQEGIYVVFDKDRKTRMRQFLPKGECGRVAIGALGRERLPKVGTPRDQKAHSWDEVFVQAALGLDSVTDYVRCDDFTALIIGQVRALRFELEEATFAALDPDAKPIRGHVEDLIRTKKFANDAEGETFRTEVMSDRARELDPALAALKPPVVILDGGRSFVKHKHDWRSASWVIILDRSSAATDEAATVLNQYYVEHRIDDSDPLNGIEPPPGIELTSFLAKAIR